MVDFWGGFFIEDHFHGVHAGFGEAVYVGAAEFYTFEVGAVHVLYDVAGEVGVFFLEFVDGFPAGAEGDEDAGLVAGDSAGCEFVE